MPLNFLKMDFLKKFKDLLIDATVGLVKEYQVKSLGLVKIEATAFYVRMMQLLHRQILLFALVLFLVIIASVSIVIVPFFIVALVPLARAVKLILALMLGIIDIGVPLFLLNFFLSEKKWMEFTKSNEMIDHVMKNG